MIDAFVIDRTYPTLIDHLIAVVRYGWVIFLKYYGIILVFFISAFLCSTLIPHLDRYDPDGRQIGKNPISVASIASSNSADVTVTYSIAPDNKLIKSE